MDRAHSATFNEHPGGYTPQVLSTSTRHGSFQRDCEYVENDQADLIRRLMDSVTKLENHARQLLLYHLDNGLARTLLVADRHR